MSTRQTRAIQSSLTSKGFIIENTHHVSFTLQVDGWDSHVRTYCSHGAKECNDFLLGQMAKQLYLTKQEFFDLVDCPLGQEKLIQMLRERGALRL
jgi:hypothetical protein